MLVESWFGPAFAELHPLLQRLHREGGTLSGPVEVRVGRGAGATIGRVLARRLGIPDPRGDNRMRVQIYSDAGALHWHRRFNDATEVRSTFVAVGRYPSGHWIERSGPFAVVLRVRIVDGAWHWQLLETRLWGIPIPAWLAPHTVAYKQAMDGEYRFHVAIALPLIGKVLSYSGHLTAT